MDVGTARQIVELELNEYSKIRTQYWEDIYTSVYDYLKDPEKDESWFRKTVRAAVKLAFADAMLVAWMDSGNPKKLSPTLLPFIVAQEAAEFGFLESLLYSLRLVKSPQPVEQPDEDEDEDEDEPPDEEPTEPTTVDDILLEKMATERADGYARTLDRLYNNVKVAGAGKTLLRFDGLDGEESCAHCTAYKGQVHPAWWWRKYDAVPPNRRFDCKGYKCLHVLVRTNGALFTI